MIDTDREFEQVPEDPGALLGAWMAHAERESGLPNHNAMMLATVGADGRPSVRTVLYKDYDPATAAVTFYTNYRSRKAQDIEHQPHVALVMHWDALERQVRLEGRAEPVPPEVSDAYFASRPREHQLGAWASDQSEPLDGFETLLERVFEAAARFGDGDVERPPHWGGYRVVPDRIEFWRGGRGRVHERLVYQRDDAAPGNWSVGWLYP